MYHILFKTCSELILTFMVFPRLSKLLSVAKDAKRKLLMVKPPKAFAPGNCNAWPDSRCSSKQYFSNFFQRCNVAAVLKSEVVHDEAPPKSYKSASSTATRPNPWPFDICHHHSTNTTTITPRLTFPFSSSH